MQYLFLFVVLEYLSHKNFNVYIRLSRLKWNNTTVSFYTVHSHRGNALLNIVRIFD